VAVLTAGPTNLPDQQCPHLPLSTAEGRRPVRGHAFESSWWPPCGLGERGCGSAFYSHVSADRLWPSSRNPGGLVWNLRASVRFVWNPPDTNGANSSITLAKSVGWVMAGERWSNRTLRCCSRAAILRSERGWLSHLLCCCFETSCFHHRQTLLKARHAYAFIAIYNCNFPTTIVSSIGRVL